jgi:diguanylate cyclase (GGDEF)-like protein
MEDLLIEPDPVKVSSSILTEVSSHPNTVNIANVAPLLEGMCFCTFFADCTDQSFCFSGGMPAAFGEDQSGFVPLPEFLACVGNRDREETALRYGSFFSDTASGKQDMISFNHSLCFSSDDSLYVRVFMQPIQTQDGMIVWGAMIDQSRRSPDPGVHADRFGTRNDISGLPGRGRLLFETESIIHDRNVLSAALVLLDIKGFHTYNDRFGRQKGDAILKGLADMLLGKLPEGASLFHVSIDTFCVLWPHASRAQIQEFMEFIQQETAHPVMIAQEAIFATFSMSAALFPSCGSSADELLANAEITLHKMKGEKRKRYAIYTPSDKRELKEKLDFEFHLTKAIRNNREGFEMYYQPLVDVGTSKLIGAEALLRWISEENIIVHPEKVIAGLEAIGYMEDIGEWILEQGIRQCSEWLSAGVNPDFLVHINITAEDLMRPTFACTVISILRKYSMPSANLVLEITETSLIRNIATCRQNLIKLRSEGVKIALDDFGTGYSSLNYLRELPVDVIKIDRVFIEDIQRDRFNHSFISAIILLAHSISRSVFIEGIEEIEQADSISDLHADCYQGFYFGRPVAASVFEEKYFKKT